MFAFNHKSGSLTDYFLKYSSHVLPLFQEKARHLCTADDGIATRDHDTCFIKHERVNALKTIRKKNNIIG